MSKRSPRLQFSDEEQSAPELKKAIHKAEKQSDKLDKAEAKIPKKTVQKKQFVVDADGKVTKHLHFEEVDKKAPPSKLSHAVKAAPVDTVLATAHREIRESQHIVRFGNRRMKMWVLRALTVWSKPPRVVCGLLHLHTIPINSSLTAQRHRLRQRRTRQISTP